MTTALFDGAAMVATMCTLLFNIVKHRLGKCQPSKKQLHMANRTIILSQARWEETMQLKNVTIKGSFKVFDSGGNWAFLLGKPLLQWFNAKQNFGMDTVEIGRGDGTETVLQNELSTPRMFEPDTEEINLTLDIKQLGHTPNDHSQPLPAYILSSNDSEPTVLTQETNPFNPERVARILKEVTIGLDITATQCDEIHKVLIEYPDCFTLVIKEVNAVPGAVHKLNILEGATF